MNESSCNHLSAIKQRIADACARSGRAVDDVELVAVSKRFPAEAIREVFDRGQRVFGESRLQEAQEKIPLLPEEINWHFIGRLQKNKVRKVLPLFSTVHSVDSLDLAETINRIAGEEGLKPKVYLQTNLANEETKTGFSREELLENIDHLLGLDHLVVLGLMAIPPARENDDLTRKDFAELRELRDLLAEKSGKPLSQLSMGMSSDFEIAIEEGATIVRVGSAIFGERN